MKIKPEHFAHIKAAIDATIAIRGKSTIITTYETGKFFRADRVKNLQERFCWDMFYEAGLTKYACDNVYSYAHDDHIYTALKKICPTVTRRY